LLPGSHQKPVSGGILPETARGKLLPEGTDDRVAEEFRKNEILLIERRPASGGLKLMKKVGECLRNPTVRKSGLDLGAKKAIGREPERPASLAEVPVGVQENSKAFSAVSPATVDFGKLEGGRKPIGMAGFVQEASAPGREVAINPGGLIKAVLSEETASQAGERPGEEASGQRGRKASPVGRRRAGAVFFREFEVLRPPKVLFEGIVGVRRGGPPRVRLFDRAGSRPPDPERFIQEKITPAGTVRPGASVGKSRIGFERATKGRRFESPSFVFEESGFDRPERGVGRDGQIRFEDAAQGLSALVEGPEP
jgi:hypothetical protein